ncbi:MAG: hypothetical protein ACYC2J_07495 [Acidithiobacillus ferrooxidans]|jgi:hypothetical protein|uniref:Uncharacterized protein n=1 Tax=Acidithiobacillus ferruginosus TaxID=3063951 RepID=A0ACD5IKJ9_9PROT|nr:hypothetical protein [Acidithiobacillus ferruginosus]
MRKDFAELRERLKPLCKRTLHKQVLEYVKYTSRHALVQEFFPTDDEQRLYDEVSEYLQQPVLYALPSGQRQLMTLVLRKLLASSSYAPPMAYNGRAVATPKDCGLGQTYPMRLKKCER